MRSSTRCTRSHRRRAQRRERSVNPLRRRGRALPRRRPRLDRARRVRRAARRVDRAARPVRVRKVDAAAHREPARAGHLRHGLRRRQRRRAERSGRAAARNRICDSSSRAIRAHERCREHCRRSVAARLVARRDRGPSRRTTDFDRARSGPLSRRGARANFPAARRSASASHAPSPHGRARC